jgi:capsular polysaccharide biosynthesis protein
MVNEGDATVMPPLNARDDLPEPFSAYEDFTAADEPPGELATGLVSLGFITAALRRSARFLCAAAAVGLLLGIGSYASSPPAHQASTTILLVPNPDEEAGSAILTDVALAQSLTVAGRVVRKLGLHQSASDFVGSYTVTALTDRVLLLTVGAPSSSDAVVRAAALATEFLQFRAQQAQSQEQIVLAALQQQVTQAKQHIKSVRAQISRLSAQPASAAHTASVNRLRAQLGQADSQLASLQQTVNTNQASTKLSTTQLVRGSRILDAAVPLSYSHYKRPVLHAAIGLIAGLALGLGIVILRALVSDRLRRRDDVAYALGASVKLSVGRVRVSRWLLGRRGLAAARGRNIRRIVAFLQDAVPERSGPATLAVVAVDDARVAALSLTSLATSRAEQGWRVVLADLCPGAPAARYLGAKDAGVHAVVVDDAHLVVAVPGRDEIAPVGPLHRTSRQGRHVSAQELAAAYGSADLLLTLVTLDPSVGAEHLATWATDSVVIVTAGRSSATKIHAVGEMIRLASVRLASAVLVGADKTDESLGMTYTPRRDGLDAAVVEMARDSDQRV